MTSKELIEETRSRHKVAGMSDRFKFCLHCEDEWPCDASRLADALEAATRVPVQGEPNDDREAVLRVMRQGGFAENLHEEMREKALQQWADEFVGEGIGISRATVPDAALAEAKKQLGEIQRHFTAIAGSGEIRVYEDTGEKHGIDYQASVWAKRGERMTRDLIEFLGEHHRPEPVGNGESK